MFDILKTYHIFSKFLQKNDHLLTQLFNTSIYEYLKFFPQMYWNHIFKSLF